MLTMHYSLALCILAVQAATLSRITSKAPFNAGDSVVSALGNYRATLIP